MMPTASHPNFPKDLDITPLVMDDDDIEDEVSSFTTAEQAKAIKDYGIAGRVWESAKLLNQYFDLYDSSDWQVDPPCSMLQWPLDSDLTIIELGSGTGYVGLKLADKLLKRRRDDLLFLTDLPDVCPLLNLNVRNKQIRRSHAGTDLSKGLHIEVIPLPWGDTGEILHLASSLSIQDSKVSRPLTHIVCSDVVYYPSLYAPLLRTLLQLTSPPFACVDKPPEIVVSYKIRSLTKEAPFWAAFGVWYRFSPVLVRHTQPDGAYGAQSEKSSAISHWQIFRPDLEAGFIFIASRRPESYSWGIPDSNEQLMSGYDTGLSFVTNSDDTFDSLLLMHMLEDD